MVLRKLHLVTLFLASLFSVQSYALTTRSLSADSILSADGTKTWSLSGIQGPIMSSGGVVKETPGGAIDDSNVTFTLTHAPGGESTLLCFLDGSLQRAGTDYNRTTTTITMTTAPATGQLLECQYSRN
jgi:hypothetical protein